MDPIATLKMILDHIAEHDYSAAKASARDLENWLCKGGFYPMLDADHQRDLIGGLIDAVCTAANYMPDSETDYPKPPQW